ncbi:sulfotransferase [Nannochloropsis oceanica]
MLRSNRPTLPTLFYVLGGLFGFLLLLSSRRLPVELSSQGLGPHLRNFQERAGEHGGRREDGELVWTTEKSLRPHETKEERKDGDLEKEKGSVEAGSHVSHGAAGALSEQGGSAKTDHEKAPREDEDEESAAAAATAIPREENEGGEEKRIKVFMDFQQSRASWGVAHNRALESVLTQHPEAEIVVLVSAPDLYKKYHYADALGRPFFQKYFKRGYNVTIQPVNENTFLAEGMDEDLPGRDWFVREFYNSSLPDSQCPKCNQLLFREFNQALTAVIPMAPLMYIRWAHLWKEGGVYTDFSVLWHRPFPAERYFDMSPPACSPFDVKARENYPSRPEPSVLGPEQVTPVEKRLAFPTPPAGMLGSMHMHFHKHDRVLACAMIEIGTPRFRKCFNESTEYGRDCVQTIMRLCIAHENTQVGGGEEGKEESPPPPSAEGRKDAAMSSLPSSLPPSKHSVREGGVVAWFQCNGSAGDAAPAVERWREDPQVAGSSALWLGRYVRMGVRLPSYSMP